MRDSGGFRNGIRSNALWGSGSRGDSRKNALWGSGHGKRGNALWGGRRGGGVVLTALAALTLVVPLAAGAKSGRPGITEETFISPGLLEKAQQDPGRKLHVIVQSAAGTSDASGKIVGLSAQLRKKLDLIGAIAIDIPAGKLAALAKQPGLIITPDASVHLTGTISSSAQMWPYETGLAKLWGTATSPAPQAPTIAIVDSGIEANRLDFDNGSRVVGNITLTGLTSNSPGDGRGHGTFVAGIAAGSAEGYTGAAPNAGILSIDVMDDSGTARTSDVIAACEFIMANKGKYNIRVANFSLHSAAMNHFYHDPLDQAVEKLWFNGIFVVAAAGNYGSSSGPSGVLHAPGNDPFVMTVGAVDIGGKLALGDDANAPWSAYGYTEDGFSKPELGAPGRYMVGPVPMGSTLVAQKPASVVKPGYIELSGTSFAAPVVAGAAAQIIARHPNWTPDQVKGALMMTAKPVPQAAPGATGVGQLNAARAAELQSTPPNANLALSRFLTSSGSGGMNFDSASWASTVAGNASWAAASWADASWSTASWSAASWAAASWSAASWADASWADASWALASWADSATEDGADGEVPGDPAQMSADAFAELQNDPDLALPPALVPTATALP
jgi:serine protease AprX